MFPDRLKNDTATFQLAVLRTELSNSTTLLSHTQASIALMLSGFGFLKLFDLFIFDLCGLFFLLSSIGVFARGVFLYRRTKKAIEGERNQIIRIIDVEG